MDKENEIPSENDESTDLEKKIMEDLWKLKLFWNCGQRSSATRNEQWFNIKMLWSFKWWWYHFTFGLEETRNFIKCPESGEENLVTHFLIVAH